MRYSQTSRIQLCILFSYYSFFPQRGSLMSCHAMHLSTYQIQNLPLISLYPVFMMIYCWLNLFVGNKAFQRLLFTNRIAWLTVYGSSSAESMLHNKHLQKCQWLTSLNANSLFMNSCWMEHLSSRLWVKFNSSSLIFHSGDSVSRGSSYLGQSIVVKIKLEVQRTGRNVQGVLKFHLQNGLLSLLFPFYWSK